MSAKRNFTDQEYELLSAYLDGVLSESERAELEAQLSADDALRGELEALRETVGLVKGVPMLRAPHDFRLTAEMVRVRPPRWLIFPTTTAFSALTAAAAILLLFFGSTLLFGQNQAATSTGVISAFQQDAEAQVAVQPTALETGKVGEATIVADLFYAATPSTALQSGAGGADDNGAFAGTVQEEAAQEPSQSVLPTASLAPLAVGDEAEQGQPSAPSDGLAARGTQPPPSALPEVAGESNLQEAPSESVGQAGNAPNAAMADQAITTETDSAGMERAELTPTPALTLTATTSATLTLKATIIPSETPTDVATLAPAPIPASPVSSGGDLLPTALLLLGALLLVVAGVTSWTRWRRR